MKPKTLDHVAFWVADREPIVGFPDAARRDARHRPAGRVHPGRLRRAARKADAVHGRRPARAGCVQACCAARVGSQSCARGPSRGVEAELGEGVRVRLVEAPTDVEYDLDHVALVLGRPRADGRGVHGARLQSLPTPSAEGHPRVEVGGAYVEFHPGDPGDPDKPLLNHVAVLVDEVDPVHRRGGEARASSTTSSTPRTRVPSSCGARSACASSTSSTSRDSLSSSHSGCGDGGAVRRCTRTRARRDACRVREGNAAGGLDAPVELRHLALP